MMCFFRASYLLNDTNLVADTTAAGYSRILTFMVCVYHLVDRLIPPPERFPTQWNPIILSFFLLLEANIPPAGTGCGRLTEASVGSIVRI
jgi:hypothetical protein